MTLHPRLRRRRRLRTGFVVRAFATLYGAVTTALLVSFWLSVALER